MPRVFSSWLTVLQASEEVPEKKQLRKPETNGRKGNKLIDRLKAAQVLVSRGISDPTHHSA